MNIPEKNHHLQLEKTLLGTRGLKGAKGKDVSKGREITHPSSADRVEISEKALYSQQLTTLVLESPDVRTERVEAIQEKIEAGAYDAQASKIAEKLIRSTLLDDVF